MCNVRLCVQDVADGDVSKYLVSNNLESPHIVAFITDNQLQAAFIVGDTVYSEVQKGGMLAAALTLMCTYYVLDLKYPRPYSMILAAFQEFVAEEPYKHETSKSYKTFVKVLQQALSQLP